MDNVGTMTITGALRQMSLEPRMGAWECNVCTDAIKYIEKLEAELSAYRELGTVEDSRQLRLFAERAKRDYTECDKMFIHISELDKALKETTHENN